MRSYPRNSPEAAARIVALVLISDGHVCRSEFDVLRRPEVSLTLGLAADDMHRIVQELCEDLLMGAYAASSVLASIDAATLASIMAEIEEPALQRKVVELATIAAHADQTLAEGEALILEAAARHWHVGSKAAAVEASSPAAL
jgi:hypothetical protein